MYVARNLYKIDLHGTVHKIYRQVFFDKEVEGINLPFHLEREFKKYLTCGIPAYGLARFHCSYCQKDKIVAFSCKGRTPNVGAITVVQRFGGPQGLRSFKVSAQI